VKKVLLVCAATCNEVEECLIRAGCVVSKVPGGPEAVWRAKHDTFDVVILVSSGKDMDRAETALNLRDINSSVPIIVIRRPDRTPQPSTRIAEAIENTVVFTLRELDQYVREWPTEVAVRRRTSSGRGDR
jgi:PleD family two-component response regulator